MTFFITRPNVSSGMLNILMHLGLNTLLSTQPPHFTPKLQPNLTKQQRLKTRGIIFNPSPSHL